jgi:hypothetical protein
MHDLDPEDMPMLFKALAKKLRKFMERFNEFPEFNGIAFMGCVRVCGSDSRGWTR